MGVNGRQLDCKRAAMNLDTVEIGTARVLVGSATQINYGERAQSHVRTRMMPDWCLAMLEWALWRAKMGYTALGAAGMVKMTSKRCATAAQKKFFFKGWMGFPSTAMTVPSKGKSTR